MSVFQKVRNVYGKSICFYLKRHTRTIHTSYLHFADTEASSKKVSEKVFDILEELREPELTEEEILQKRFKSRLPERVYRKFVSKEPVPLDCKFEFQMKRLRAHYARFGKDSKLNPGLCWPTREEILETIKYDKVFEPSLESRLKNVEEARLAEENRKREVEAEVDKNMANLDKWIGEFHAKKQKKAEEVQALRIKKEMLVDEIREYLGYDIDPRDPRFQEAVEQKKKEQKKTRNVKKQQENYDKMIAKLKQMAEK